jgi:hypothetical protein
MDFANAAKGLRAIDKKESQTLSPRAGMLY